MSDSPYRMTLSLNLLNHLGINLYSNIPAVLSEAVANAWDADAETVDIKLDKQKSKITITDNGQGMDLNDVNQRFLTVGFRRRDSKDGRRTKKWKRAVMGRKGIGKLSLFSIARDISIYTVKGREKHGFRMLLDDIQRQITRSEAIYKPKVLRKHPSDLKKGTRIVLTDLKKSLGKTESALIKRLARRFSILGEKHHFALRINKRPIAVSDRGYFKRLQYLWIYGQETEELKNEATNASFRETRSNTVNIPAKGKPKSLKFEISGWIGTVKESGHLADDDENLNKIVIMVRGKMAQEDILEDFNEGGIYTKYLIGELHADFLDLDEDADIATSSRQRIIEDDPRYLALRDFVRTELKHIQNKWTALRNEKGTEEALQIPAIKAWFSALGKDSRKHARALFGKINQIPFESNEDKKRFFKYGVLAFEHLQYKQNLDALDDISAENLETIGKIFAQLDDIEASLYHQIISGRIEVIETLQGKVAANELENVIRDYVAEHLWLLDPSWERATDGQFVEASLKRQFLDFANRLTTDEKKGRLDIKYSTFTGTHVIIELKRPNRNVSLGELLDQGDKYSNGLKKLLAQNNREKDNVEIVFLVGKWPQYWNEKERRDTDKEALRRKNMRVLLYSELLDSANRVYKEYISQKHEAGRVQKLLSSIESSEMPG